MRGTYTERNVLSFLGLETKFMKIGYAKKF